MLNRLGPTSDNASPCLIGVVIFDVSADLSKPASPIDAPCPEWAGVASFISATLSVFPENDGAVRKENYETESFSAFSCCQRRRNRDPRDRPSGESATAGIAG